MKSVLAFLAINAFLVAVCVLFAGLYAGAIMLGRAIFPGLSEHPLFTLLLGFAALALTIWIMVRAYRFIVRPPSRSRERARE
jgi:hypothetical protein